MSAPAKAPHQSVMLRECLDYLHIYQDAWYVDATFGAGGHTNAILKAGGCVLAIDQDPDAKAFLDAAAVQQGRLRFAAGNFADLEQHVGLLSGTVAGILLDLGVSSMQLDQSTRGFSFRQSGPLDMRMAQDGLSAADLVQHASYEELASLIYRYGEERHSRRIARKIVEVREKQPLTTTDVLAEVVASAYPPGKRREHPARRTFQALRIAVNDELGALERALDAAEKVLMPGGRVVVLSYHSLEDRRVKHFFKNSRYLSALTRRPESATEEEIANNPRARSAKLRAAQRTQTDEDVPESGAPEATPA